MVLFFFFRCCQVAYKPVRKWVFHWQKCKVFLDMAWLTYNNLVDQESNIIKHYLSAGRTTARHKVSLSGVSHDDRKTSKWGQIGICESLWQSWLKTNRRSQKLKIKLLKAAQKKKKKPLMLTWQKRRKDLCVRLLLCLPFGQQPQLRKRKPHHLT